jgi:hypothetical protein
MFQNEGPQILGATVQNLVATATRRLISVYPHLRKIVHICFFCYYKLEEIVTKGLNASRLRDLAATA